MYDSQHTYANEESTCMSLFYMIYYIFITFCIILLMAIILILMIFKFSIQVILRLHCVFCWGSINGQPQGEGSHCRTVKGNRIQSRPSPSTLAGSFPWAHWWSLGCPTWLSCGSLCRPKPSRNVGTSQPRKQPWALKLQGQNYQNAKSNTSVVSSPYILVSLCM